MPVRHRTDVVRACARVFFGVCVCVLTRLVLLVFSLSLCLGPTCEYKLARDTFPCLFCQETVARFISKPAALVFNMGYNTNAGSVPSLAGKVRAGALRRYAAVDAHVLWRCR